ncbi:MAG: hypothetical protein GXP01_01055, partial [Alphaproteobacteria bacterium]|nr:hypothetical protein [Alphaproteobacteria bacterium]
MAPNRINRNWLVRTIVMLAMAWAGLWAPAVLAFEIITVPETINAVNLSAAVDIVPGENGRVQFSTAPGEDGIIRRIQVQASEEGTNPSWALFALSNNGDAQIERLL